MGNPSNTTVIPVGYVGAGELAGSQLGPGVYSLNKRSNVPFVGLVGSSGFRKTISWGEIAEVSCDELVTVQNQSFHGGDIFLNKGRDICNRPSRITVPVQYQTIQYESEGTRDLWQAEFPCDTRGAKRAYLMIDAFVNLAYSPAFSVFVRGRRLDGSMRTENVLASAGTPFGPGVGYLNAFEALPGDNLAWIPLGQGASFLGDDGRPHNLLDAADAFILLGLSPATLSDAMTWPADSGVNGYPVTTTTAPGTWYCIEYD